MHGQNHIKINLDKLLLPRTIKFILLAIDFERSVTMLIREKLYRVLSKDNYERILNSSNILE